MLSTPALGVSATLISAQALAHVLAISPLLAQAAALLLCRSLQCNSLPLEGTPDSPCSAVFLATSSHTQQRNAAKFQVQAQGPPEPTSYADKITQLRARECPQLRDPVYLDAAGAPPYPASLVQRIASDLSTHLYSNPHSRSPSSLATAARIDAVRFRVMRDIFALKDPENWDLVFTSGATASLKLVGDSFDWVNGDLHYLLDSAHTSLVGLRDLATQHGASTHTFSASLVPQMTDRADLVALPLQCNASGRRFNVLLDQILRDRRSRLVLVDAASYLSGSQNWDLSGYSHADAPDLVALSFYKLFGLPTGLGALLVKRATAHATLGSKRYFGGGTVDAITPSHHWTQPRSEIAARCEDGTPNLHAIIALEHALEYYQTTFGDWPTRRAYVAGLTHALHQRLSSLRHSDDSPVVRLYSPRGDEAGPVLSFNVLAPGGGIVPPSEVDRLASVSNIHLRAGRHCNPGFVVCALGASEQALQAQWAAGLACDDAADATSASVRVSLSILSTPADVQALVAFIARFFQHLTPHHHVASSQLLTGEKTALASLGSITLYPIKSCAGQRVAEWELRSSGLAYDRAWAVKDVRSGRVVSQKRHPRMAQIQPIIDVQASTLSLSIAGKHVLTLSLEAAGSGPFARDVVSAHLGVPAHIVPHPPEPPGPGPGRGRTPILYSNESPFLAITSGSLAALDLGAPPFRANFTLDTGADAALAFVEDRASRISIGDAQFGVLGQCRRCQMVSIDQVSGDPRPEVFRRLAQTRRNERGRIIFGSHLAWMRGARVVRVDMPVSISYE